MLHQLSRGFGIHSGLLFIALFSVVSNAPDAAQAYYFVQLVLLDFGTEIRSLLRPLALLNNAVVHIGNIQGAIRGRCHVNGAK